MCAGLVKLCLRSAVLHPKFTKGPGTRISGFRCKKHFCHKVFGTYNPSTRVRGPFFRAVQDTANYYFACPSPIPKFRMRSSGGGIMSSSPVVRV